VTALAAVVLAAAAAQEPPPTFGVETEAVYVDAFVTEANRPVTGLTEADFELKDNGAAQHVELVAVESLPLTTFLVLDTSESVVGEKLVQLQAAARGLLGGLRAGDQAGLVTFDHEIRVRVPPTGDRVRLERGVNGILGGGSTALLDAVYAGTMLASGGGRSLLVVFTDGEDNLSWLEPAQVRRVLEESNVLVQAVGVVARDEVTSPPQARRPPPSEPVSVRVLRELAEVTGGRFWPAASPDKLGEAFLAIADAMKTRYVLRFEPSRTRREGLHQLEVKLTRRKGTVHCRKAYFVGPRTP
jgi:Ca-activated chloride channel family protein